nr:hypothetical protein [Mucilaginibacter sp. X4EP1]
MNNPLQRRGLKLRSFLEPSPCATAKAARGWRGQGEAPTVLNPTAMEEAPPNFESA